MNKGDDEKIEQRRASWSRPGRAASRPGLQPTAAALGVGELIARLTRGRFTPDISEAMVKDFRAKEIVVRFDPTTLLVTGWSVKITAQPTGDAIVRKPHRKANRQ